eukprot:Sspe_Gene.102285::Locus_77264_Transcript_1_1_Confidence_1.000_Length_419::g.102285::m.102285
MRLSGADPHVDGGKKPATSRRQRDSGGGSSRRRRDSGGGPSRGRDSGGTTAAVRRQPRIVEKDTVSDAAEPVKPPAKTGGARRGCSTPRGEKGKRRKTSEEAPAKSARRKQPGKKKEEEELKKEEEEE